MNYPEILSAMLPANETRAVPVKQFAGPNGYTEAELSAYTDRVRYEEDEPCTVPDIKPGTWRYFEVRNIDRTDYELEVLLELPISAITPVEDWPNQYAVEKYARWTQATGVYPPLSVTMCLRRGVLSLRDGHHRLLALKSLGYESVLCWVNMSYFDERESWERSLTLEDAQRLNTVYKE